MGKNTVVTEEKKGHFKTFTTKQFKKSEIAHTTIIVGGLSMAADRIVAAAWEGLGYKVLPLPVPDMEAMQLGKEYCDGGLCNPTYFTIGNLVKFLNNLHKQGISKKDIVDNYLFLTAGSCGPCRFGMYEYEYRLALNNAGYTDFRVQTFQMQGKLNQGTSEDAIVMDLQFFRALLTALIVSDHFNNFTYMMTPYEVVQGSVNEAIDKCILIMQEYFKQSGKDPYIKNFLLKSWMNKGSKKDLRQLIEQLRGKEIEKYLKKCSNILSSVQVDYTRMKPKVKITGEFWAQTTEGDGNYQMFSFLQSQGCEIIVETVSAWIVYLIWLADNQREEVSGVDANGLITWRTPVKYIKDFYNRKVNNLIFGIATFFFTSQYNRYGKILKYPAAPIISVKTLEKVASKYMQVKFDGGEGFLEVAKNIYYTTSNKSNMVLSVKPFGCMPSTISDSVQSKVVTDYKDMVFLPVETSGEGKINALSRVQMALGEAKAKAVQEYSTLLAKYNLDASKVAELKMKFDPETSALVKIPEIKGYRLRVSHYIHYLLKLAGKI